MKTFKNTITKAALAVALAFTGIATQAQISASASADENATAAPASTNTVVTYYSQPLAFEASMRPILNAEKIQLRFGKMEGSTMSVTLFDAQGNALNVKRLDKNDKGFFVQSYDIKELSDGDYKFVLQSESTKIVKKFEVQSNSSRAIVVE